MDRPSFGQIRSNKQLCEQEWPGFPGGRDDELRIMGIMLNRRYQKERIDYLLNRAYTMYLPIGDKLRAEAVEAHHSAVQELLRLDR